MNKTSMVNRYAVMGSPVAHSLSPLIHQHFAQQIGKTIVYETIETCFSQFEKAVYDFFSDQGQGLNITSPFKEAAFSLAAVRTTRAQTAKSANTLWMQDGLLYADNTDGAGLIRDVSRYFSLSGAQVLILGAGGAVRGIIGALYDAGVLHISVYNRTSERLQRLCDDFPAIIPVHTLNDAHLFGMMINATGIREADWSLPVEFPPASGVHSPFCYDLSYRLDMDTAFLAWAKQQRFLACDGRGMLVEQAAESFYIWHNVRLEQSVLDSLFERV